MKRDPNRINLYNYIKTEYFKGSKYDKPVQCMNDQILLYVRYLCAKKAHKLAQYIDNPEEFQTKLENIIKQQRGDLTFNGQSPVAIAATLFYILCCAYGVYMTQKEVGEEVLISTATIRLHYKLFKKQAVFKNIEYGQHP